MRKADHKLVIEVELDVIDFLDMMLPGHYVFHTIRHTLDVEKNVRIIGDYCGFSEMDLNIARISALFHDVGYVYCYQGHETESVRYAEKFLQAKKVEEAVIQCVRDSIMATEIPQHPKDHIGNILCDADLMHLTYDNYFEQIELMRLEWNNIGKKIFSPLEFHLNSISFFNSHHYYSEYGKNILQPKKEKILKLIKKLVADSSSD